MSLLKLENFADALLNKYETTTLNEGLTDCGFMSNFNEDFFVEEKKVEVKPLNESFNGSINECSVFSLDDKEELTETVARSPRYELEDLGNLIEDAKAALEDKDMENMYLFGHTIYDFIEENRDELNDVVIDELGNLQDELEAEAQKLDESCNKNLKEGFSDDLFVKAVDIVVDFIHDDFDSIPEAEEVESRLKENMGEFSGLIGDQAEIIDVAATYFDLPSIVEAALDVIGESLDESKEDKSDLDEQVEDVYWYSNSEFKEDLTWLANNLTDYFFKEMESAHWGISKKDVTNVFNTALNNVLDKMRNSDDCTLFEDCNKEEISEDIDVAAARPNHMKILDAIENGYIDYQMVAEELLRWMADDKLADFIGIYADFEDLNEDINSPYFPDADSLKIGDTLVTARDVWYCSLKYQTKDSLDYKRKIGLYVKDDGVYIPKDSELKIVSIWKRPERGPVLDVLFNGKKISVPNYNFDNNPRDKFFILARRESPEEINLRTKINKIIDNFHPVIKQIDNLKIEGEDPYLRVLIADKNSDFEGWMDAWNDGEVIVEWEEHPQPNSDEGHVYFDMINNDKVDEMSGDLVYRKCKKLIPKRFVDFNESVEEIKPTHRGRKLHSEE